MKTIQTCPHCGLQVAVDADRSAATPALCPRCENPIHVRSASAVLVLESVDGTLPAMPLHPGENSIGRKSEKSHAEIQVPDPTRNLSKSHATITVTGNETTIRDAGSLNGTFVNNQRLVGISQARLKPGDKIRLGNKEFIIRSSKGK